MAFVLIEHLVGDFETFKQVYLDDGERLRTASPSSSSGTTRTGPVSSPSRWSCTKPCGGRRATSPRRESASSSTWWTRRS